MENIIVLLDHHLNANNPCHYVHSRLKLKHPKHNILMWSIPDLFKIIKERKIQKVLLGDIFIILSDFKPKIIYLAHAENIDNSHVIDSIHQSFLFEKPYFRQLFRKKHYETISYPISDNKITKKIAHFVQFNQFNNKNFKSIILHPTAIGSPNSVLEISTYRPIYTCITLFPIITEKFQIPSQNIFIHSPADHRQTDKKTLKFIQKNQINLIEN